MAFLAKYFKGSKSDPGFNRNFLTLMVGTVISQAIPLLIYPVISRMFTPEEFGVYALFISLISFQDIIATGRYELAVVVPEKDREAVNIMAGGFLISIVYNIIIFIVLLIFNDSIAGLLNNQNISPWLFFVPLAVFIISTGKLLNYWLTRKKAFRAVAVNKIVQRSGESATMVTLGYFKLFNGLIIGDMAGRFMMSAVSLLQSIKAGLSLKDVNLKEMAAMLKRYREFPLLNSVPALLNSISFVLPVFIISAYYSDSITGHFNFSRQLLAIPIALISANVSQILLQQFAEKKSKNQPVFADIRSLIVKLSGLAMIFALVLVFFGPELFSFVFGEQWKTAGDFSRILVISSAVSFVVSPLSVVLIGLEKIKAISIWQFAYFLLICILFLTKGLAIRHFLILLVCLDVVAYSAYLVLIVILAKKYDTSLERKMDG